MPGRIRTMGAGLGGSTAKNVNVNANTGGGNKKQGLSTTTNKRVQFVSNAIKNRSYGENRNMVFCMNQLGGVGAVSGGNGSRMFGTTSDGVKDCITGPYGCEQQVREAYLEAFKREPDLCGLRTYCIAMSKRRWSKADVIADLKKNGDSLASKDGCGLGKSVPTTGGSGSGGGGSGGGGSGGGGSGGSSGNCQWDEDVEINGDNQTLLNEIISMLLINLGANGQIPISILYDANILSEGDDDDTALLTAINQNGDDNVDVNELGTGLAFALVALIKSLIIEYGTNCGVIENSAEFNQAVVDELDMSGQDFIDLIGGGDGVIDANELMAAGLLILKSQLEDLLEDYNAPWYQKMRDYQVDIDSCFYNNEYDGGGVDLTNEGDDDWYTVDNGSKNIVDNYFPIFETCNDVIIIPGDNDVPKAAIGIKIDKFMYDKLTQKAIEAGQRNFDAIGYQWGYRQRELGATLLETIVKSKQISSVGKPQIIEELVEDENGDPVYTLKSVYSKKWSDGKDVVLSLWDIGGEIDEIVGRLRSGGLTWDEIKTIYNNTDFNDVDFNQDDEYELRRDVVNKEFTRVLDLIYNEMGVNQLTEVVTNDETGEDIVPVAENIRSFLLQYIRGIGIGNRYNRFNSNLMDENISDMFKTLYFQDKVSLNDEEKTFKQIYEEFVDTNKYDAIQDIVDEYIWFWVENDDVIGEKEKKAGVWINELAFDFLYKSKIDEVGLLDDFNGVSLTNMAYRQAGDRYAKPRNRYGDYDLDGKNDYDELAGGLNPYYAIPNTPYLNNIMEPGSAGAVGDGHSVTIWGERKYSGRTRLTTTSQFHGTFDENAQMDYLFTEEKDVPDMIKYIISNDPPIEKELDANCVKPARFVLDKSKDPKHPNLTIKIADIGLFDGTIRVNVLHNGRRKGPRDGMLNGEETIDVFHEHKVRQEHLDELTIPVQGSAIDPDNAGKRYFEHTFTDLDFTTMSKTYLDDDDNEEEVDFTTGLFNIRIWMEGYIGTNELDDNDQPIYVQRTELSRFQTPNFNNLPNGSGSNVYFSFDLGSYWVYIVEYPEEDDQLLLPSEDQCNKKEIVDSSKQYTIVHGVDSVSQLLFNLSRTETHYYYSRYESGFTNTFLSAFVRNKHRYSLEDLHTGNIYKGYYCSVFENTLPAMFTVYNKQYGFNAETLTDAEEKMGLTNFMNITRQELEGDSIEWEFGNDNSARRHTMPFFDDKLMFKNGDNARRLDDWDYYRFYDSRSKGYNLQKYVKESFLIHPIIMKVMRNPDDVKKILNLSQDYESTSIGAKYTNKGYTTSTGEVCEESSTNNEQENGGAEYYLFLPTELTELGGQQRDDYNPQTIYFDEEGNRTYDAADAETEVDITNFNNIGNTQENGDVGRTTPKFSFVIKKLCFDDAGKLSDNILGDIGNIIENLTAEYRQPSNY